MACNSFCSCQGSEECVNVHTKLVEIVLDFFMVIVLYFFSLFKFLFAIAYMPTIQDFPGLSRNLTICPGFNPCVQRF